MKFSDCIKVKNVIYAISSEYNLIFKHEIGDEYFLAINSIPEEAFYTKRLCMKMLCYNNKILFIPCNASSFWLLDLNTNIFEKIETDLLVGNFSFSNGFIYKTKAFMIGCLNKGLAVYDFEEKKLHNYEQPYNCFSNYGVSDIYCHDYYINGDRVFIPSCISNEVLEIDLEKLSTTIHKIGDKSIRLDCIEYLNNKYYLTTRNSGQLIICDSFHISDSLNILNDDSENLKYACGIYINNDYINVYSRAGIYSGKLHIVDNKWENNSKIYLFCHKEDDYMINQDTDETIEVIEGGYVKTIENIKFKGIFSSRSEVFCECSDFCLNEFLKEI